MKTFGRSDEPAVKHRPAQRLQRICRVAFRLACVTRKTRASAYLWDFTQHATAAPLQLARVEGQKASLESELRAATEDLEVLPARLEEAMAAADSARGEAQASADKVGDPGPKITH